MCGLFFCCEVSFAPPHDQLVHLLGQSLFGMEKHQTQLLCQFFSSSLVFQAKNDNNHNVMLCATFLTAATKSALVVTSNDANY